MRPISFTEKDGKVRFHYKFSELREWYTLGRKHGDVGFILWGREGKQDIYRSFGTLEHPMKEMHTISMIHNPAFDGGERMTPQEIVDYVPKPWWTKGSYKLVWLNTGEEVNPQP